MLTIDHVTLSVSDLVRAREWYAKVLAPLGMTCLFEGDGYCGFGKERPLFWLADGEGKISLAHIAFAAANEGMVQEFHAAGLAAGGTDNGAPGPRPEYHEKYYGAFLLDPDGNNIEAVFGNM